MLLRGRCGGLAWQQNEGHFHPVAQRAGGGSFRAPASSPQAASLQLNAHRRSELVAARDCSASLATKYTQLPALGWGPGLVNRVAVTTTPGEIVGQLV